MYRKAVVISASVFIAGLCATPASASYMSNCEKLIAAWNECRASGSVCKVEQKALETECKCHKQKGEEWKLVIAAVGKDGVCAPRTPTDMPPPPPPEPPRQPVVVDPPHNEKEERDRRG